MAVKTAAQGITNCPRALPAKLEFALALYLLLCQAVLFALVLGAEMMLQHGDY